MAQPKEQEAKGKGRMTKSEFGLGVTLGGELPQVGNWPVRGWSQAQPSAASPLPKTPEDVSVSANLRLHISSASSASFSSTDNSLRPSSPALSTTTLSTLDSDLDDFDSAFYSDAHSVNISTTTLDDSSRPSIKDFPLPPSRPTPRLQPITISGGARSPPLPPPSQPPPAIPLPPRPPSDATPPLPFVAPLRIQKNRLPVVGLGVSITTPSAPQAPLPPVPTPSPTPSGFTQYFSAHSRPMSPASPANSAHWSFASPSLNPQASSAPFVDAPSRLSPHSHTSPISPASNSAHSIFHASISTASGSPVNSVSNKRYSTASIRSTQSISKRLSLVRPVSPSVPVSSDFDPGKPPNEALPSLPAGSPLAPGSKWASSLPPRSASGSWGTGTGAALPTLPEGSLLSVGEPEVEEKSPAEREKPTMGTEAEQAKGVKAEATARTIGGRDTRRDSAESYVNFEDLVHRVKSPGSSHGVKRRRSSAWGGSSSGGTGWGSQSLSRTGSTSTGALSRQTSLSGTKRMRERAEACMESSWSGALEQQQDKWGAGLGSDTEVEGSESAETTDMETESELDLEESLDGLAKRLGYQAPSTSPDDDDGLFGDEGVGLLLDVSSLDESAVERTHSSVRRSVRNVGKPTSKSTDNESAEGLGLGLQWGTTVGSRVEKSGGGDDLMSSTMLYRTSTKPSPRYSAKFSVLQFAEPSSSDEEEFDLKLDHTPKPLEKPTPIFPRSVNSSTSGTTASFMSTRADTSGFSTSASSTSASIEAHTHSLGGPRVPQSLAGEPKMALFPFQPPPGTPGSAERRSWAAAQAKHLQIRKPLADPGASAPRANERRVSTASAPESSRNHDTPEYDANLGRRASEADFKYGSFSLAVTPPMPPTLAAPKSIARKTLRQPASTSALVTPSSIKRPGMKRRPSDVLSNESTMSFASAGQVLSPIPWPSKTKPSSISGPSGLRRPSVSKTVQRKESIINLSESGCSASSIASDTAHKPATVASKPSDVPDPAAGTASYGFASVADRVPTPLPLKRPPALKKKLSASQLPRGHSRTPSTASFTEGSNGSGSHVRRSSRAEAPPPMPALRYSQSGGKLRPLILSGGAGSTTGTSGTSMGIGRMRSSPSLVSLSTTDAIRSSSLKRQTTAPNNRTPLETAASTKRLSRPSHTGDSGPGSDTPPTLLNRLPSSSMSNPRLPPIADTAEIDELGRLTGDARTRFGMPVPSSLPIMRRAAR